MSDSHLDLAVRAVRVFADDGTLDLRELDDLLAVALRDGAVDADERRVLANIFGRVPREELPPEVWARMAEIRRRYDI